MLLVIALTGIVGTVFVAAGLVAFDRPPANVAAETGPIDFESAISGSYDDLPDREFLPARDGSPLYFRLYEGQSANRLILLVHGSGWHGMQFHKMAKTLAERGLGTVLALDLRGHGLDPERRGDIDYIGQFEDDIADLIDRLKSRRDYEEVVLGGHSSGGGLVVRFAGGVHGAMADRLILMAPFLKYNAPTTRTNSGGWASPATQRIVGLTILNAIGINWFNHLPVISFAMPRTVLDGPYGETATTQYSFRLNQSFAPRADYEADLRAIHQPLLVIAGAEDEAFIAERYETVISAQTATGTYAVLPGINHIGVTVADAAIATVADWIAVAP